MVVFKKKENNDNWKDRSSGYTTQAASIPCPCSNAAKQGDDEDDGTDTNEQIDEPAGQSTNSLLIGKLNWKIDTAT